MKSKLNLELYYLSNSAMILEIFRNVLALLLKANTVPKLRSAFKPALVQLEGDVLCLVKPKAVTYYDPQNIGCLFWCTQN